MRSFPGKRTAAELDLAVHHRQRAVIGLQPSANLDEGTRTAIGDDLQAHRHECLPAGAADRRLGLPDQGETSDDRSRLRARKVAGEIQPHAPADHGHSRAAPAGADAALNARQAVRGVDRAVLDGRTLGGLVANGDRPGVSLADHDVQVHHHLVHANVGLLYFRGQAIGHAIGRGGISISSRPEVDEDLRLGGVAEAGGMRREHEARTLLAARDPTSMWGKRFPPNTRPLARR